MGSEKVAMFLPSVLPDFGGTQVATFCLARELGALALFDVTIRAFYRDHRDTPSGSNDSRRKSGVRGLAPEIPVWEYPVLPLPQFRGPSQTYRSTIELVNFRLIADLNRSEEDIVHVQGAHRPLSLFLLVHLMRGKTTVLTTHTLQETASIMNQSRFRSIILPLFARTLRKLDHIIALSKLDERLLVSMGVSRERISIIPNGVDEHKFEERRSFVKGSGRLKILTVGQFNRNKNFETLILAVAQLSKSFALEVYVVGGEYDPEYLGEIQRLVRHKGLEKIVTVVPSIDGPALTDCYLSCDVFVLLSRAETFPLVVLEAMYAGLPIVATRVGAIPDIVTDNVNGFLVSPDDVGQICDRLSRLFLDAPLRVEIRARNKAVAKAYTWSRVAQATSDVYHRLAEG